MVRYPCKGCGKRMPGCHAGCEEYQAAREADRLEKQKRAAAKAADELIGAGQNRRDNYYRRVKKNVKIAGFK